MLDAQGWNPPRLNDYHYCMLMQRITVIRLWIIMNINEIMLFGKRYQKF